MRKRSSFVICCLLILTLFVGVDIQFEVTPIVEGAVIYVGGTGGGNLSTIQEGVDAASPGDTIYVFNGTYNEDVDISKSIYLVGESQEGTIHNGGVNYAINLSFVDGIHINRFQIKGKNGAKGYNGGDVIVIENSTATLSNLTVEGGVGGEVSEPEGDYFEGGIGVRCYNSTVAIFSSKIFGGYGINGLDDKGSWNDVNNYGNGGNGSEGLISNHSEITLTNSCIKGGRGGDGGYGGDGSPAPHNQGKKGGDGGNAEDGIKMEFSNVTIENCNISGGIGGYGGNGGTSFNTGGLDFGGNSGKGGMALYSQNSNLSVKGEITIGGNAGSAGNGGLGHRMGGWGGIGGDGGDGLWTINSIVNVKNETVMGGNGGGGGNGGSHGVNGNNGGNGGKGIVGIHSYVQINNISVKSGSGGVGGNPGGNNNGGSGGSGGNGGTGLFFDYSNCSVMDINIITGSGGKGRFGWYTTYTMSTMGISPWGGWGGNGGNGGDAIISKNSNFTGYIIDSISGNGNDGGYGGNSISQGGGDGGDGGSGGSTIIGIASELYINRISMVGGHAGHGSYGGDSGDESDSYGGDGGIGGNGGKLRFEDSNITLISANISAGNGGNGGDGGSAGNSWPGEKGGNGGDGGIGGDGIYAINSNATLENSTFTCGFGGLGGNGGSGFTPGIPGSDGRDGTIYVDPSRIIFLNSLISGGDSENPMIMDSQSSVEFKWYLHVRVLDSTGKLVANADVIIKDNANGTFEENYITDENGYVKWIVVTESIFTQSGKSYYTPYNITAISDGNVSYVNPEPWVNQSMEVISIFGELNDYLLLDFGWNLISIPKIQVDNSFQMALQNLDGRYTSIQWFNSSDTKDPWKHYSILKPSHMNDLKNIDHSMGFWIHINQTGDTFFLYGGTQPMQNQTIPLYKGWNMVGYPSLSNKYRTDALNNLIFGTHVDAVWTYNSGAQKWEEVGDLNYFVMGKGYWIHATSDCTWEVPI